MDNKMTSRKTLSISTASLFPSTKSKGTAPAPAPAPAPAHCNFITFLATAQKLQVPFLPTTWQGGTELGGIDGGGTSQIDQAPANKSTSLALKRVKDDAELEDDGISKEKNFQRLINELMLLWHPVIRVHPNIIELQGVSWDIRAREGWHGSGKAASDTSGQYIVWPVFVFEKSELRDLSRFAESAAGRELSIFDRLQICLDIGRAIEHMHSHNIVHGDIKPANIIVFEKRAGSFVAKVADLGYSCWFSDDSEVKRLAVSRPWHAPELARSRELTMKEAIKAEVFSFGMLCLSFIFERQLSGVLPLPDTYASSGRGGGCVESLTRFKREGLLADVARRLVEMETGLNGEQKKILQQCFDRTLVTDRHSRCDNMQELLDFRTGQSPQDINVQIDISTAETSPADEADFQLGFSLNALYSADYRVRSYIVHELQNIFDRCPTGPTTTQLALCYKLRFGHLHAGRHIDPVGEEAISTFEEAVASQKELLEQHAGNLFKSLSSTGQGVTLSVPDVYLEDNILEPAEIMTRNEIEGLTNFFGPECAALIALKSILSSIKLHQNQPQQGLGVMKESVNLCELLYGKEHRFTLSGMIELANLYASCGKLEHAERLMSEVVDLTKTVLGEKDRDHIASKANLAAIYTDQGRFKLAVRLYREVLTMVERDLYPPKHPVTLTVRENMALAYYSKGNTEKAVDLMTRVIQDQRDILSPDHPNILLSMVNLSRMYVEMEEWDKAHQLQDAVVDARKRVLGLGHPLTLEAIDERIETYEARGLHEKVIQLQLELLGTLSDDHPQKLKAERGLAAAYRKLSEWAEANRILEEALRRAKGTLGSSHPDTLACATDLFFMYLDQDRIKEAVEITPAPHPELNAKLLSEYEQSQNRTPEQVQASKDRAQRAERRRKLLYG